jgi:uncharacterized membrane protein YhaH (DUF805 family)
MRAYGRFPSEFSSYISIMFIFIPNLSVLYRRLMATGMHIHHTYSLTKVVAEYASD